ncbi:MAG: hypothetical protein V1707_02095 [bacterium]
MFKNKIVVIAFIGIVIGYIWFLFRPVPEFYFARARVPKNPIVQNQEFDLVVEYRNPLPKKIYGVSIKMYWPKSFPKIITAPQGYDYPSRMVPIGDLNPGQTGELEFKGYLASAVGEPQPFITEIYYYTEKEKKNKFWYDWQTDLSAQALPK